MEPTADGQHLGAPEVILRGILLEELQCLGEERSLSQGHLRGGTLGKAATAGTSSVLWIEDAPTHLPISSCKQPRGLAHFTSLFRTHQLCTQRPRSPPLAPKSSTPMTIPTPQLGRWPERDGGREAWSTPAPHAAARAPGANHSTSELLSSAKWGQLQLLHEVAGTRSGKRCERVG